MHWEEDVYLGECPEVGTACQGEMIEEAMSTTGYAYANLQQATELYLEEFSLAEVATLKLWLLQLQL